MAEVVDIRFPCPGCGADLRFDPPTGAMVCTHCGHAEPIATGRPGAIREHDFDAALQARLGAVPAAEERASECPNCGARILLGPDETATECPFCATPLVAEGRSVSQLRPDAVLPFALDERAARGAMTDWLGSLWFAPSGLKAYARQGRPMQGVYVPHWTFDADTRSRYRGERGTVYYETVTVMRQGRPERKRVARIRWRPVRGEVARVFDDVLALASRALPAGHAQAIEPWDLSALEPYRPEFLAGFRAEAYQVPLEEGFAAARGRMERVIARDVRFDIGGDRQRIHEIDTVFRDVTFKHVLLPVWLAAYRFRGKTYQFVVNGQTGRVSGQRPWSRVKLALAILAGALLAGAAGYFIATNQ